MTIKSELDYSRTQSYRLVSPFKLEIKQIYHQQKTLSNRKTYFTKKFNLFKTKKKRNENELKRHMFNPFHLLFATFLLLYCVCVS